MEKSSGPGQYARLDARPPVRLRLNSTVVRVLHDGAPDQARTVRVAYVRDGRVHTVSARNVILACFNTIVRFLMPELPEAQKQALADAVKVPMLYSNVFVRNWRAFERLRVSAVSARLYRTSLGLDSWPHRRVSVCGGGKPIGIHPSESQPARPPAAQAARGDAECGALQPSGGRRAGGWRACLAGGFDPATDILAFTANRWPHGYAYTYDTLGDPDLPEDQRPHVVGRRPFGRVAIANSDSGAGAFINVAIDQAHRAVQELLARHGLK
jgi:spermidine dehydrogenase